MQSLTHRILLVAGSWYPNHPGPGTQVSTGPPTIVRPFYSETRVLWTCPEMWSFSGFQLSRLESIMPTLRPSACAFSRHYWNWLVTLPAKTSVHLLTKHVYFSVVDITGNVSALQSRVIGYPLRCDILIWLQVLYFRIIKRLLNALQNKSTTSWNKWSCGSVMYGAAAAFN